MHCWHDLGDGSTCMEDGGHDGPHVPTDDSKIVLVLDSQVDEIEDRHPDAEYIIVIEDPR